MFRRKRKRRLDASPEYNYPPISLDILDRYKELQMSIGNMVPTYNAPTRHRLKLEWYNDYLGGLIMLTSGSFWKAAIERSIKSFAGAALALLTGDGLGLVTVDWLNLLSVSGLAALTSILFSISSDMATGGTGPSLVGEVNQKKGPFN